MYKLISLLKRLLSPYYKEILKSIIVKFLFKRRKKNIKQLFDFPLYITQKEDIKLIIFLVIDCLRKDHLSLYGYRRDTTPFFKKIGNNAAIFTNAVSPSNWTCPSVTSILSGLYPHNHGGMLKTNKQNFSEILLPIQPIKTIVQIQDILGLSGFDTLFLTSIVTASFPVEGTFKYHKILHRDADYLLQDLKRVIKKGNRKKFLYVQFGDLHQPNRPPLRYRNHFGEVKNLLGLDNWGSFHNIKGNNKNFLEFKENKIKLYDSTLFFVDQNIKQLFRFLKKEGLIDSTLIILTSDHGEGFWEHKDMDEKYFFNPRGNYGCSHANNLFQETISIPLIIYGNEVKNDWFNHNVSLVDIFPTILDILGIKLPKEVDGENLFTEKKDRFILIETNAYGLGKKAVLYKQYKMHYSLYDNIELVFNLKKDPNEKHPLTNTNFPEFEKMRNYLHSIKVKISGETININEETKKQLSQLGYF